MTKLMKKKLFGSAGGFTLAELLVVIAILAILIAIAVPVFTHMVAEANLRVNQANVHSVRSAAVAHILTNLGENDDREGSYHVKLNQYMNDPDHAWIAVAEVDNDGNISGLMVYAVKSLKDNNATDGISTKPSTGVTMKFFNTVDDENFFPISDDVKNPFATVKPSMGDPAVDGGPNVYYVQAVVTDLTKDAA